MRVRHQREAGLSVHFSRERFLHATHCHGQLACTKLHASFLSENPSVSFRLPRVKDVIPDDAVSNSFNLPQGKDKTALNFLTVPLGIIDFLRAVAS